MKLSIGMAAFDDPESVAFTLHSLMAHHGEVMPECELIVVDNHPGTPASARILGICGWLAASSAEVHQQLLAKGEKPDWQPLLGKMTYIPMPEPVGTSASRERIFLDAKAPAVLCIDSHVLLPTGELRRLIDWYDAHPDTMDLFQGPLVLDNHRETVECFDDLWRDSMWGTWKSDSRGKDPDGEPFEIQSMGLGLFTCRKEAWIRFPAGLRGFGGEEHNLHAMWRKAGRKTLCLPFLRWWHLFRDPKSPLPYSADTWDRVRNYVIWANHLGMDTLRLKDHFVGRGVVTEKDWEALTTDPIGTVQQPSRKPAGCGSCGKTVAADVTLDGLYDRMLLDDRASHAGLNRHLPKLRELASQCAFITEIAARSDATVAFLHAQPLRLISHNWALSVESELAALPARKGKTDLLLDRLDSLSPEAVAEKTDLLFIDELPRADRIWAQLEKYGTKTRRYIVFHDTHLHAEVGVDNQPGVLPAIRRWVKEHPEWSVVYHTVEQYGLTVLSCNPDDKPALPSLPKMVWNYAKHLAKHIATGAKLAGEEVIAKRLDECALCDQRVLNRCTVCGCPLDEGQDGREGKALWLDSACDLAKW